MKKKKELAQKATSKLSLKLVTEFAKRWQTPLLTGLVVFTLTITSIIVSHQNGVPQSQEETSAVEIVLPADSVALPLPSYRSGNSVEAALKNRRLRLDYNDSSLTLAQVSQFLWAAQGVNVDWGDRTAPSAKSTYPLTIYLIANNVTGLDAGEYQYIPGDRVMLHQLKPIKKVDMGDALFDLLNQSSFRKIPAVLVIAGDMSKMAEAYGGIPHDKEVYLEAGYASQNVSLQAESLKLGTTISTNFDELKLRELITVSSSDTIILLMPIGLPR